MSKNYFDTDSTGDKGYFQKEDSERKKHGRNVEIKEFSISTDKYRKSQVKVKTVRYEIKD